MAIRDGILAVLSLGPGYGLAVRDELLARAPHRTDLNVGQVYSTLDRLVRDGLVDTGTLTDDNLPLYTITPEGLEAVARWLSLPAAPDPRSWSDLMDQVLIGSSLPGRDWEELLDRHDVAWRAALAAPKPDAVRPAHLLAESAMLHWAQAALAWLDDARVAFGRSDPALPLRGIRPLRGRRPQHTPEAHP
ncbi:DNA-binding PadR family transcriptional regulator [Mycetocola sp. CAN_C7]|uniref:PadR family transcriptional regulator n=1 Tax=Mycetocola sp. CAN_C7 TaxID=2787724 RepID=UPI0018CAE3B5